MFRYFSLALLGFSTFLNAMATADMVISLDPVASVNLLPNTANQRVDLFISGSDNVTGLQFRAVIGDGQGVLPEFAFNSITFYDGPGGVNYLFDASTLPPAVTPGDLGSPGSGTPKGAGSEMLGSTNVLTQPFLTSVSPSGTTPVLASVYVSTVGFSSGAFAFTIDGSVPAPNGLEGSSFVGLGNAPGTFVNGTLAIAAVPEPSAVRLIGLVTTVVSAGSFLAKRRSPTRSGDLAHRSDRPIGAKR